MDQMLQQDRAARIEAAPLVSGELNHMVSFFCLTNFVDYCQDFFLASPFVSLLHVIVARSLWPSVDRAALLCPLVLTQCLPNKKLHCIGQSFLAHIESWRKHWMLAKVSEFASI